MTMNATMNPVTQYLLAQSWQVALLAVGVGVAAYASSMGEEGHPVVRAGVATERSG
jgi:hypothetical protein